MITLKNISKTYDDQVIFKDVNLTINENDKVAIIGKNGAGKSTLLNILKNNDHANFGEVVYAGHSVEFLDQEQQLNEYKYVSEVVKSMKAQVDNIINQINVILEDVNFATSIELIKQYGELENSLNALGGYELESHILKVLARFGFSLEMMNMPISTLSGGQKTRLALVKIIIKNPDFLILDEPTNHLDIDTIQWLEQYLKLKAKGVIIVSHDRFFIERVCNKIIEVENNEVKSYETTYTNFLNQKQLNYNVRLSEYKNQQSEIKKLNEFIDKFRNKPSKIGQVNDRKSKLAKIKIIEEPLNDESKISFKIESLHLKKNSYIELINCKIGYENKTMINDVNLLVNAGDRIGIVGENASGKSTLIKTILKQIKLLDGRMIIHPKIKIGYFDQNFVEYNNDSTIYDEMYELFEEKSSTLIRKHLSQFLFFKNDVFKKVNELSGGEKVRFLFAKLVLEKYDLLIMDEPTNHLDFSTKRVFEQALKQYESTLILVSHDRYFLNEVVNHVCVIHQNQLTNFDGNYENYLDYKNEVIEIKKENKKFNKKKIVKKQRSFKKIEEQITSLEIELEQCIDKCQLPEYYEDHFKMNNLQTSITDLEFEISKLYEELENKC